MNYYDPSPVSNNQKEVLCFTCTTPSILSGSSINCCLCPHVESQEVRVQNSGRTQRTTDLLFNLGSASRRCCWREVLYFKCQAAAKKAWWLSTQALEFKAWLCLSSCTSLGKFLIFSVPYYSHS